MKMEFEFEQTALDVESEAMRAAEEEAGERLIEIDVDKLFPHPDNPRRDLGDLTELTESIRERGIFQNLTVVRHPFTDNEEYTVVIGHRRLEAAKRAGLKTVPCRVTYMSEREMMATMLLENMQRSDLTPLEEAEGMQMMIDFGETVSTISKKTGLSESTVRRRTRLTKLDQDKLKKVLADRQITMTDLDRLFDIEDEDKRNRVLEHIGTRNFEQQLVTAKKEERAERARVRALSIFEKLGVKRVDEERKWQDYNHVTWVDGDCEGLEATLRECQEENGEIFFEQCHHSSFRIWKRDEDGEREELSPEEALMREREEMLLAKKQEMRDKFTAIYALRREWVEGYTPTSAKRDVGKIIAHCIKKAWSPYCGGYYDKSLVVSLADPTLKLADNVKEPYKVIKDDVKRLPEYYLFLHVYVSLVDGQRCCFDYYTGKYKKQDALAEVYDYLTALGYEMSEEEELLLSGKHPIYKEIEELSEGE